MEAAQGRARTRAQAVCQEGADLFVGGQGLGGAPGVPQGAEAEGLEGFVEGVGVAEGGEVGEGGVCTAQGEGGGEAGAVGVEAAGLPAGGLGRAVGEVGERRALPEGERVVEDVGGLGRVAVGERAGTLVRETFEAVQVDVVRGGREAIAAVQ